MAGMVVFAVLAAVAAATWSAEVAFPAGSALALFATWLALYFLPRIIGTLDAFLDRPRRYGGRARLLASSALEALFTFALTPIANITASVFMVGLLFGRKVGWDVQRRDGYGLSWEAAAASYWPHTAFGGAILLFLMATAPGAIPWFVPFLTGPLAAIPFAVITSSPALGVLAARWKLFALPEEIETPAEIAAIMPACARATGPITLRRRARRRVRARSA
jgi:membrane glycosyltransferase